MSQSTKDIIELAANFAAILTAFVAVIFFFKTLKKSYYLNDIPGNYKIFSNLKDIENTTALYHIKISYVSQKGWFFGYLQYSEIFKDPGKGSGGMASVFGKINYSFFRIAIGMVQRVIKFKKYNPLEVTDLGSFHGNIFFLNRNDLDISRLDWRQSIAQEYSIIHYRDSHRFKLLNPKMGKSYLQLPIEFTLINVDKVPDQMLAFEI